MDDLKHRLRTASFIAFDDGGNDYTTAQDALAAIEALEAQVAAADALAAWAKAISERKASPATGGRLVLERDLVGLETALAAYNEAKKGGA